MESVVNQTFRDFEYIVIDGASTDGSVEVIKQYQDRIHYWVSEPDTGIYNAMNKGIRVAQGEYLLFLNSGDWLYEKEVVEKVKDYLKVEIGKILTGDIIITDYKTERLSTYPEQLTYGYMINASIAHQSTFIYKKLFSIYGLYDEDIFIVSDWAFFFKTIIIHGEYYTKIPVVVSYYNSLGVSNTMKNTKVNERKIFIREKYPTLAIENIDLYQKIQNKFSVELLEDIVKHTNGKKSKNIFISVVKAFFLLKKILG